jgi:catechol 2,3-dioxygenase-like lactoylglutathione lyase family enzyme
MSTPADLIEVAQIAVNVQDLARATAFYRDVLGLPVELEAPGLAFFRCGAVRLMLARAERSEFDHPASIIYYRVGDLDGAHARLVERGVAFGRPPHLVAKMPDHELWMAFCEDAEGNTLALMEERR